MCHLPSLSGLVLALSVSAIASVPVLPEEPRMTLAPGESATVESLRLRFDEVVTDSRCPTDVDCVWAGLAEVAVTVASGGESTAYRLFVGAEPGAVVHDGVTIALVRVAPERLSTRSIEADEYRATFEVRR